MIQPIAGGIQPAAVTGASPTPGDANNTGTDFLTALRGAVDQVSQLQSEASMKVSSMLTGDGQDVHSAMIAVQKADLAFELMVEMRNKIVSAYQEISRIPF